METPLDLDELGVRVLGSLIEKEATTPDNYPLTLNALTAACNQTTNRDPVLHVSDADVAKSLAELERRALVRVVHRSDSRARRWRHLLAESLHLHPPELAALCVLLLRGAQTAGEIRTRTARLHEFGDVAQVEITLQSLMTLAAPLATQLPRRAGQKEVRYAHLLAGEPAYDADAPEPDVAAPAKASRIEALENDVAALRSEVAELRTIVDEFRRQFE